MVIWKYELKTTDVVEIELPEGSQILTIQVQYQTPCIWALVDPEAKKTRQKILIVGAGHEMPATAGEYIGTYQLYEGQLIFHAFKERD